MVYSITGKQGDHFLCLNIHNSMRALRGEEMYKTPTFKLMWLTLNRGCNFRCEWCYAAESEYRTENEMSLPFALDLLEIARQLGVGRLFLIK